jgi:preprotein translocase subunit SecE
MPDNKLGRLLSKRVPAPKPLSKFFNYVKESRRELKKVTWPKRREALNLTLAVLVFTAIFTGFTTLLDLGLEQVVRILFL